MFDYNHYSYNQPRAISVSNQPLVRWTYLNWKDYLSRIFQDRKAGYIDERAASGRQLYRLSESEIPEFVSRALSMGEAWHLIQRLKREADQESPIAPPSSAKYTSPVIPTKVGLGSSKIVGFPVNAGETGVFEMRFH